MFYAISFKLHVITTSYMSDHAICLIKTVVYVKIHLRPLIVVPNPKIVEYIGNYIHSYFDISHFSKIFFISFAVCIYKNVYNIF